MADWLLVLEMVVVARLRWLFLNGDLPAQRLNLQHRSHAALQYRMRHLRSWKHWHIEPTYLRVISHEAGQAQV